MSVSRNHASLHWYGSAVYLEDCDSKFGTLRMLHAGAKLGPGSQLSLQCGRTMCMLEVERPWSLFACFGGKIKRASEAKSKREDPAKECLPGEGKNSLLVVRRKNYQRLLRKDEKTRRDQARAERMKAIRASDSLICGASKMKDMGRVEGINTSFVREQEPELEQEEEKEGGHQLVRAESLLHIREPLSNAAKLQKAEAIRGSRGDTADDVCGEDCTTALGSAFI